MILTSTILHEIKIEMDLETKYFNTINGVAILEINLLREDGVALTTEEGAFISSLDIPNERDSIVLPDNSIFNVRPFAVALLEFLYGWYVSPEHIKSTIDSHSVDVAKSAFAKFYPDVIKRFPTLLDSPPVFIKPELN